MISNGVQIYNPQGPDRLIPVVIEAVGKPDHCLIRSARGAGRGKLTQDAFYDPYPEAELAERKAKLPGALQSQVSAQRYARPV